MKLEKVLKYKGTMQLLTGLSIAGNGNSLNIGGADSEVIKNPITGMPYVPGSSLKGKMRSRMELLLGKIGEKGAPCGCGEKDCLVCTIFGAHKNVKAKCAPTRIIVRDCELTEDSRKKIESMPLESGSFLEVKSENSINREKGTAESPRFIERVPAGMAFNVEIVLQVFNGDDEKKMKEFIEKALQGVEDSYLGGNGSRGYGQVKFTGGWE